MITLPLKTRGAPVMEYGACVLSTVAVSHSGLPVFAFERDEAAVERSDDDLAFVHRGAAAHDVTADEAAPLGWHLRVVLPQLRAGARVERIGDGPGGRQVHHAVDDDGRAFDAALGVEVVVPGETELAYVAFVDLLERAVTLLGIGAADGEPVAGFAVGLDDALGVDGGRTAAGSVRPTRRRTRRARKAATSAAAAVLRNRHRGDPRTRNASTGIVTATLRRA